MRPKVWKAVIAVIIVNVLFATPSFASSGAPMSSGRANMDEIQWRDDGAAYRIRNVNSDLCLVHQRDSDGRPAFQYLCWFEDQFWYVHTVGGGYYQIYNWLTFNCLTVDNAANGAKVVGSSCRSGDTKQQWYISVYSQQSRLENRYSGKCMVIQTGNLSAEAFQYTCLTYLDQYWYQDWWEHRN